MTVKMKPTYDVFHRCADNTFGSFYDPFDTVVAASGNESGVGCFDDKSVFGRLFALHTGGVQSGDELSGVLIADDHLLRLGAQIGDHVFGEGVWGKNREVGVSFDDRIDAADVIPVFVTEEEVFDLCHVDLKLLHILQQSPSVAAGIEEKSMFFDIRGKAPEVALFGTGIVVVEEDGDGQFGILWIFTVL